MALKMCATQSKKMYPSQMSAIRAAISYSKKRGTPLRVYRHSCGAWHLSKKPLNVDTNDERRSA